MPAFTAQQLRMWQPETLSTVAGTVGKSMKVVSPVVSATTAVMQAAKFEGDTMDADEQNTLQLLQQFGQASAAAGALMAPLAETDARIKAAQSRLAMLDARAATPPSLYIEPTTGGYMFVPTGNPYVDSGLKTKCELCNAELASILADVNAADQAGWAETTAAVAGLVAAGATLFSAGRGIYDLLTRDRDGSPATEGGVGGYPTLPPAPPSLQPPSPTYSPEIPYTPPAYPPETPYTPPTYTPEPPPEWESPEWEPPSQPPVGGGSGLAGAGVGGGIGGGGGLGDQAGAARPMPSAGVAGAAARLAAGPAAGASGMGAIGGFMGAPMVGGVPGRDQDRRRATSWRVTEDDENIFAASPDPTDGVLS